MRLILFCHSLLSDWNNGNAHFLRGVVTELAARGHAVRTYEPADGWSVKNLLADHGAEALEATRAAYPGLDVVQYDARLDLDEALDGADVVLVHEWNDPELVARIGRHRARSGNYRLFFHDTHHRSVSDPLAMNRYELDAYDGVLAFGAAVKDVYERTGWGRRAWVWHEAADARRFHPPVDEPPRRGDVCWIGNWGDDERTAELQELLLDPVRDLGLETTIHGVRYPDDARRELARRGIPYRGWLANYDVPLVMAAHTMTVHVPRRPYVEALPGIPTIRVFEALACGAPLVSGAWSDVEHLFTPGEDFLVARDGDEMRRHMRLLLSDDHARRQLAGHGRRTVLARHTCAHRVDELLAILATLEATKEISA